ncbi:STAS/SEC14 domain-containing protein [Flavobacteriaceae bacterium F08102]|nr:STAS/SEC14 domain-containing protein [Flavobacteriaceae bacterium F08102]
MVTQLKEFKSNMLALEVKGGFTEADEKYCQALFNEKLNVGYKTVNILVKLDEMELFKSSVKAFFEDTLWIFKNYKELGHLAVVSHSKALKMVLPIDNLFFEGSGKQRSEKYFDISEMEEAYKFIGEEGALSS